MRLKKEPHRVSRGVKTEIGKEDAGACTEAVFLGPLTSSVVVGGTWHKLYLQPTASRIMLWGNRRSTMLLQKYRENKQALKQIGREALAESRRLGLTISAKDRQNEAKDQAKRERKDRVPATVR